MGSSCSCHNQNTETLSELVMHSKLDNYQKLDQNHSNFDCISSSENTLNQMPSKFMIVYPGSECDFQALHEQLQAMNKNGQFVIKQCCQIDYESEMKCSISNLSKKEN